MIRPLEIRRRARALGVQPRHIERDYVLNHVLAALSERDVAFVFRGGTALARVYWPDVRLSEDLDFIVPALSTDVMEALATATAEAAKSAGRSLSIQLGSSKDGLLRSSIVWADHELQVDVSKDRNYLPVRRRRLILPYSDLATPSRTIRVESLAEILGSKWFMLSDRREPRDLFDLWAGFVRYATPFEQVARSHQSRYGFAPTIDAIRMAENLSPLWSDRLAHQLGELPEFTRVLQDVRDAFKKWRQQA